MKTAILTYPQHHFVDITPLTARYMVLTQSILTFLTAGCLRDVMRATQKVRRLIRLYSRLDTQNRLWARKLEMLSDRGWRERVLRDLGGLRKLKLWDAACERILERRDAPLKTPQAQEPAWLYTPDRIAESERLKAKVRQYSHNAHNLLIVRNRFHVDFEGEFRLAPLPRRERAVRRLKVYTAQTLSDYDWDPTPFEKDKGLGAAAVWPVEFYAAAALEANLMEGLDALSSVISAQCLETQTQKLRPNTEDSSLSLGPAVAPVDVVKPNTPRLRDDKREWGNAVPLHLVLDRKTYRDIFENPV